MLGNAPDLSASGIWGQIRCPVFTCFKVQAASSETTQLASGDSPVRNCQSLVMVGITIVNSLHGSEGSCREEPVAVVVVATFDECSEKLGGGLVAKTSRENSSGKPSTREAWSRQSPRLCSTAMSDVRQHADLAPERARSPHQVWETGRHCLLGLVPGYGTARQV